MEPINTISTSVGIRNTPIKSSSTEAHVKATTNTTVRPEFVSPKGTIDAKSGVYVVQIRNASTEMLNFQYPNKKVVAEYARSDKLIPASENKAQELSSATLELSSGTPSVDKKSVGLGSSVPAPSSGQMNSGSASSLGSNNVAPLGTTAND
jgi:hypothetical protein